jgi:hypothetical protein
MIIQLYAPSIMPIGSILFRKIDLITQKIHNVLKIQKLIVMRSATSVTFDTRSITKEYNNG